MPHHFMVKKYIFAGILDFTFAFNSYVSFYLFYDVV